MKMLLLRKKILQWRRKTASLKKRKTKHPNPLKFLIKKKLKLQPAMKVKKKTRKNLRKKRKSVILLLMMVLKFLKRFLEKLLLMKNQRTKLLLHLQLVPLLALNHQKRMNSQKMKLKRPRSLKLKVTNSLSKVNTKRLSNNIPKLSSVMFLQPKKLFITVTELW